MDGHAPLLDKLKAVSCNKGLAFRTPNQGECPRSSATRTHNYTYFHSHSTQSGATPPSSIWEEKGVRNQNKRGGQTGRTIGDHPASTGAPGMHPPLRSLGRVRSGRERRNWRCQWLRQWRKRKRRRQQQQVQAEKVPHPCQGRPRGQGRGLFPHEDELPAPQQPVAGCQLPPPSSALWELQIGKVCVRAASGFFSVSVVAHPCCAGLGLLIGLRERLRVTLPLLFRSSCKMLLNTRWRSSSVSNWSRKSHTCQHTHTHTHTHTYAHIQSLTHIQLYTHSLIYTDAHTRIHAGTNKYTNPWKRRQEHTHIHVHACVEH